MPAAASMSTESDISGMSKSPIIDWLGEGGDKTNWPPKNNRNTMSGWMNEAHSDYKADQETAPHQKVNKQRCLHASGCVLHWESESEREGYTTQVKASAG